MAGRPFLPTLDRVLAEVRAKPWRGTAHDADGRRMRVTVDGPGLAAVAFGATYTPAFYRELTAALRSGLAGDRRPLLRLVAEATGGGTDAGPVRAYSEGLDAAVACHDYPQLYDMTASPAVRQQQYAAALDARTLSDPDTYGPFTVHEYADSDWQSLDWCTQWPSAPAGNPAGPPLPSGGHYSDVPVLVLSGELDSITTPAEGDLAAGQFPNARHVTLANSFHVTAVGDTDDCAVRIVRSFVASPVGLDPGAAAAVRRQGRPGCARWAASRRAAVAPASRRGRAGSRAHRRRPAGPVVEQLLRPRCRPPRRHLALLGDRVVRFRLSGVRLVPRPARLRHGGLGPLRRDHDASPSTSPVGHLEGSWDTRTVDARAVLTGRLGGRLVRAGFPAP